MKLVSILIVFLLSCSPLVAATGVLSSSITLIDETTNRTANITINTSFSWNDAALVNQTPTEAIDCSPLLIEGLPMIAEDGEKLSYEFTPWESGDKVTYWIEDIAGEEVKGSVTTTTKSKKQYTPHTDKEEQALFFKATREREGCNESESAVVVVIQGSGSTTSEEEPPECVCEEPEQIACDELENPITSLYVLAKNHDDEVLLHGNAAASVEAIVFGEEAAQEATLPAGKFSIPIHPLVGANTYGIVTTDRVITTTFTLNGEEEEETSGPEDDIEKENTTGNVTTLLGSYSFDNPMTGAVVLENDTHRTGLILAGTAGIAGLGVAANAIKRKHLRNRQDSAEPT